MCGSLMCLKVTLTSEFVSLILEGKEQRLDKSNMYFK